MTEREQMENGDGLHVGKGSDVKFVNHLLPFGFISQLERQSYLAVIPDFVVREGLARKTAGGSRQSIRQRW